MAFHVDTPRGKHIISEDGPTVFGDEQFVLADSANLYPQILRSPAELRDEFAEFVDDLNAGDIIKVWLWRPGREDPLAPLVVEHADDGWCVRSCDDRAIYAAAVR
jgi:hypothetical protein